MKKTDIRWVQRFDNFNRAFKQLISAHELLRQRPLTELENQGMIQAFEFTHELAWNVLKDYIEFTGGQPLIGSKDTSREAFQKGLIDNGNAWMEMIKNRNLSSHTYNQTVSSLLIKNIVELYIPCFQQFAEKMTSLKNDS